MICCYWGKAQKALPLIFILHELKPLSWWRRNTKLAHPRAQGWRKVIPAHEGKIETKPIYLWRRLRKPVLPTKPRESSTASGIGWKQKPSHIGQETENLYGPDFYTDTKEVCYYGRRNKKSCHTWDLTKTQGRVWMPCGTVQTRTLRRPTWEDPTGSAQYWRWTRELRSCLTPTTNLALSNKQIGIYFWKKARK